MRVLLLVSSFNGLTQRVWCHLREAGHEVSVEFALDPFAMSRAAEDFKPDLILCPFLKERVPERVWHAWRTIIIHPGPVGDRGPSSLDHAITEGASTWGVTALQAVEEMDAGPVWATRSFPMPAGTPRKTTLYNGPVSDATMACVAEVMAKAADATFSPVPLEQAYRPVPGTRLRPQLRQADRAFSWEEPAEEIVRRIRAADGTPGTLTRVAGIPAYAYDASPDTSGRWGPPGSVLGHADGAVLVAAGSGGPGGPSGAGRTTGVWLGHLRQPGGIKLPATMVLRGLLRGVPRLRGTCEPWLSYDRHGRVGTLTFRPYNGALSTRQCRQLTVALRFALAQDTDALVVRGAFDAFCNGIHLGVIEAARDPAVEAWANIRAINAVCRRICATSRQVVIAAYTGSAGAGGAMLALGADVVVARSGVVLNAHYDMGLFGSELHTLTLPRRVGADRAARLLDHRLPLDAAQALSIGLVDATGPRDPALFTAWLGELAERAAAGARLGIGGGAAGDRGRSQRDHPQRPLAYHETAELAEMARDMFDDRNGFADKRKAFVHKLRPPTTPSRLALHRSAA